jgi:hypothetical protein
VKSTVPSKLAPLTSRRRRNGSESGRISSPRSSVQHQPMYSEKRMRARGAVPLKEKCGGGRRTGLAAGGEVADAEAPEKVAAGGEEGKWGRERERESAQELCSEASCFIR